jgi:uncharacterized protein (TIGR02453 family)
MPSFPGFSPTALAFFNALAFHQDREWFQENKALYETEVKAPMLALLEELTERFAKAGIPLRGDKRGLFRINRDIRFSKDKRPYQTHVSAVLTPDGTKGDPGLVYVHITAPGTESWGDAPAGSFVAAGFHRPDPQMLNRFRTSIRRKPKAFQDMEAKLKKAKLALGTASQLTRVPRGFEDMKGSPVEGAIRLKDFSIAEPLSEATVTGKKLPDAIVKFTERARPLLDWGWAALR